MPASFRRVDYSLRPGKHAERKMLLEVFRRLSLFAPVSEYRYVGMGSVWFSDFQLFHRALGISDMVSLEREESAADRVRDNIPFGAIEPIFEPTSIALSRLGWSKRQFVWLDYDDPISIDVVQDIRLVTSQLLSGSVLAVSVPHKKAAEIDEAGQDGSPLDLFRSRFSRASLPSDIEEADLYGRPFGRVCREIMHVEAEAALLPRNAGAMAADVLYYRRICDIEYSDGVPMTTIVGLVVNREELSKYDRFGVFDFCGNLKDGVVCIAVPMITPREARLLERQLPKGPAFAHGSIPEKDARAFADFYRYLPNFMAVET